MKETRRTPRKTTAKVVRRSTSSARKLVEKKPSAGRTATIKPKEATGARRTAVSHSRAVDVIMKSLRDFAKRGGLEDVRGRIHGSPR